MGQIINEAKHIALIKNLKSIDFSLSLENRNLMVSEQDWFSFPSVSVAMIHINPTL